MSYNIDPIIRDCDRLSDSNSLDCFLFIPYKKKNSLNYRNFAKKLGSRYDSIQERWFLPRVKMTDSVIEEVNNYNLFDGYVFKYNPDIDWIAADPEIEFGQLCKEIKEFTNTIDISKQIIFNTIKSVQYYSSKSSDYVVQCFITNIHRVDYTAHTGTISWMKLFENCSKLIILPRTYARDNWRHYVAKYGKDNVTDINKNYCARLFSGM